MCQEKKVPHVHAEVIKAWADGAEIQCLHQDGHWKGSWMDCEPMWNPKSKYRVKPKPLVSRWRWVFSEEGNHTLDVSAGWFTEEEFRNKYPCYKLVEPVLSTVQTS